MSVAKGLTIHGGIQVTEPYSHVEGNKIIVERLKPVTLRLVAKVAWAWLTRRQLRIMDSEHPGIEVSGVQFCTIVGNSIVGDSDG